MEGKGKFYDSCFHGGDFFEGIGVEFNNLSKKDNIINADVLDAWFPPAPKIQEIIQTHLPWIIKTSPPTNSEGFIKTISEHRELNKDSILPGAGSSDLIFRIFNNWLKPSSKVLILGLAFKENCPDIRNTRIIDIITSLRTYDIEPSIVDPCVDIQEANIAYNLDIQEDVKDGSKYDAVIISVAHNEFTLKTKEFWYNLINKNGVFVDPKGILPREIGAIRV